MIELNLKVGSVIKLRIPCLSNKAGVYGVVYEKTNNVAGVIFPNGANDTFNKKEQHFYFDKTDVVDPKIANYKFISGVRTALDFDNGLFNDALNIKEKTLLSC